MMDFAKLLKLGEAKREIRLTAACGCHQGKRRKNNEDNFYFDGTFMDSDNHGLSEILEKKCAADSGSFFCVFDGMGGGDYGEVASYTAAKSSKTFLEAKIHMNPYDITPSLEKMCSTVNEEVFETAQKLGSEQMGSTLAGLYFYQGQVWVCNLGDSRCFLFRNGIMRQISEDHTDEAFMKENNITGRKPYLTQFLGIDPEEMTVVPAVANELLQSGDRFLICSDGVTDMVEEQQICDLLAENRYPQECVQALIEASLDGGGKDNITVIVVDAV